MNLQELEQIGTKHHLHHYGVEKFRFEWRTISHIGIWALGGRRKDLPPVFISVSFQVPQREQEEAWWCYIGPQPEFENEFDSTVDDMAKCREQCNSVKKQIT